MAYDTKLATKIREILSSHPHVQEQEKMGGVSFMVNNKMCVGVRPSGDIMLRCAPEMTDELLQKNGAKRFVMKNKPLMKGWLLIGPEGVKDKKDFDFWIKVALAYNEKITQQW